MKNNKKAFTMIELIVVITIIGILMAIAILNIDNMSSDTRNATRISEIGLITIAVENHKSKNGVLPTPGNPQNITNSGTIINQGFFDKDVSILEITNIPTDPLIKNFYNYSTTENKLFYQLGASIEVETDIGFKAYINGNYKQIHKSIPSLVIANITNNFDLQTNSGSFIVHNSSLNIPYLQDGLAYSGSTNLTEITQELGVEIPKYAGFGSCEEIIDDNRYMGPGEYYGSGSIVCNN